MKPDREYMDERTRKAVVTGAGRGIGQAIALELADRGMDVVIADLNDEEMTETESAIERLGQEAHYIHTDLRDPESVEETVQEAEDVFGSIDILVNNSGIAGPTAPCDELSVEDWDETLAVNLRGAFLMARSVVPVMKRQEYGRIVNIASVTGKRPVSDRTPYAASKMGLIGFTRSLASEVGKFDINVNVVCPGSVTGPRIEQVFQRTAEAEGTTSEVIKERELSNSARHELVERESVAKLVGFLCSSDSDQITGQDLNISAGKVMY